MLLGGAIDVECLFLSWCKDSTAAHIFTSQHPTSVSWHYRESSWCLVFGKCHLTCCCCCLRWTCCCLGWTQGRNLICLKRTKSPFTKRQGENSLQTPWWQQYPNLCCENYWKLFFLVVTSLPDRQVNTLQGSHVLYTLFSNYCMEIQNDFGMASRSSCFKSSGDWKPLNPLSLDPICFVISLG